MSSKNSYFQILDSDSGVELKYFPPVGKGERLKIEEVIEFLQRKKIENFDLKVIKDVLTSDEEKIVKISNEGCFKFDEYMDVKVTPDKMYAIARFYPPSQNGSRITEEEILRDLAYQKIVFGVNTDIIKKHITEPEYCKNFLVAWGKKPVDGKDAVITYNFNTDRKAKPRLNNDGTVDFHELDNISHVKKGDVLAVLTPEDKGEMGQNIFGSEVRPKKVQRSVLKHGRNIEVIDEGKTMISLVDGHASIEGDKVFVSNNYEVPADVDNSTGDITYNGSVTVKGNIRTGFSIKAEGTVEVYGVVEGAKIEAGGDIILHCGIQGMGKSNISAKGNLISKFIESANVKVDGYIETDTILHSKVEAKGDIFVRGKNGSIIGGTVSSTSLIEAAIIGSPMGTNTVVEVGTNASLRDKVNDLKNQISIKSQELEKSQQCLALLNKKKVAGTLELRKVPMIGQMSKSVIELNAGIKELTTEYDSTLNMLEMNKNARIRVIKAVYQGTKVAIAGDFILVHSELSHCQYRKERGEIISSPL